MGFSSPWSFPERSSVLPRARGAAGTGGSGRRGHGRVPGSSFGDAGDEPSPSSSLCPVKPLASRPSRPTLGGLHTIFSSLHSVGVRASSLCVCCGPPTPRAARGEMRHTKCVNYHICPGFGTAGARGRGLPGGGGVRSRPGGACRPRGTPGDAA